MTTPFDTDPGKAALDARPVPKTEDVEVWLFDLDNTLYPPSSRLFDQVDRRIKAFVQDFLSLDLEAAHRLQKEYFLEFGTGRASGAALPGAVSKGVVIPGS